ncbi:MAG: hypothetical protein PHF44_02510 [Candidatus Pacebacteria bacterium]|nr:hypothetical protein [Candidatus Paceibacterota bacterium]
MFQEICKLDQLVLRKIWPLDIGCTCLPVGFYTIFLTFILIGFLAYFFRKKPSAKTDPFFIFLFWGFILVGVSQLMDWLQSLMVLRAGALVFYPQIYLIQEIFKFAGFLIIFITMFRSQKL